MDEKERLNKITSDIIGAAIEIHRALGPGLLESAYEPCMAYEIKKRGYKVEQQKPLHLIYKEISIENAYRLDLLVENSVVVEIKSVEKLAPIYEAQIMSYLKLAQCKVGLLINFNVVVLKSGIRRVVNNFHD